MEKPTAYDLIKGTMFFWLLSRGEEITDGDSTFDLTTLKDNGYIGYLFAIKKTPQELNEQILNADKLYKKMYVVFNNEKACDAYKGQLLQNVGIICSGNLYGLGNTISVIRESNIQ